MTKKKNGATGRGATEPPVVRAAQALHATLEEVERRTRRVVKSDLSTREQIVKAGELLQRAADAHTELLAHLNELSAAVEELRQRQNASARVLTHQAETLDARRQQYEGFEARFAALGAGARDINDIVKEVAAAPARDQAAAALGAAGERLEEAVTEAAALARDAREAGFVDLERQADAMRQQIQSLRRKLDQLRDALS